MINHFIREEDGQSLVEYGLLISFIALVVIVAVTLLGKTVNDKYTEFGTKF